MFDINWTYLIKMLLRAPLRKPTRVAFLKTLTSPVLYLFGLMLTYRDRTEFLLTFTNQKASMERLLNYEFPNDLDGIYIDNQGSAQVSQFEWFLIEAQIPEYNYFLSEQDPENNSYYIPEQHPQFDFIVFVPVALAFDQAKMEALIDRYKSHEKRYTIQTY